MVFAAYQGVSLLDLSGPLEALRIASTRPNHIGRSLSYECSVASVGGGIVMTADGVGIVTTPLSALSGQTIDTLIVPGACDVADVRRDRELIDWVRRAAPSCRRLCSVCSGAFVLAEAGLLEGRKAVTHWMHCDLLASSYPGVRVEPDAIYVRDGAIWSSAGVTTGIDSALALIDDDCGRTVALDVARILIVYLRRTLC